MVFFVLVWHALVCRLGFRWRLLRHPHRRAGEWDRFLPGRHVLQGLRWPWNRKLHQLVHGHRLFRDPERLRRRLHQRQGAREREPWIMGTLLPGPVVLRQRDRLQPDPDLLEWSGRVVHMDDTEFPVQPSVPELTGGCNSCGLSPLRLSELQAAPHGGRVLWWHQRDHVGPVPGHPVRSSERDLTNVARRMFQLAVESRVGEIARVVPLSRSQFTVLHHWVCLL